MTDNEKKIGNLYKRLLRAKKAIKEGKTARDYEYIIYDLQEKIDALSDNKFSDKVVALRISGFDKKTTNFDIVELHYKNKIGEASISINGKNGTLDYTITNEDKNHEYNLRAIKLLCSYMQRNGVEEVVTHHRKDDYQAINSLDLYGAARDCTKVGPYLEHKIKIK